jgi:hypothetical protein
MLDEHTLSQVVAVGAAAAEVVAAAGAAAEVVAVGAAAEVLVGRHGRDHMLYYPRLRSLQTSFGTCYHRCLCSDLHTRLAHTHHNR